MRDLLHFFCQIFADFVGFSAFLGFPRGFRRFLEAGLLDSLQGDGVDRSVVFKVFSFEICADPLAYLGSGCGQKIDLSKLLTPTGQNLAYLFKVFGMVSSYPDMTAGS